MSYISLITYENAKKLRNKLEFYIKLIENYEVDSLEKFIIKNYALTNSSSEVIKRFNNSHKQYGVHTLTREQVLNVIKASPRDDLHKIVKSGYIKKYNRKNFT